MNKSQQVLDLLTFIKLTIFEKHTSQNAMNMIFGQQVQVITSSCHVTFLKNTLPKIL